jgi:hypothetical protein
MSTITTSNAKTEQINFSRLLWIISAVFLILSFFPPLGLPVSTAVKVVLNLMHVVAAAAIVGVLTTLGREK